MQDSFQNLSTYKCTAKVFLITTNYIPAQLMLTNIPGDCNEGLCNDDKVYSQSTIEIEADDEVVEDDTNCMWRVSSHEFTSYLIITSGVGTDFGLGGPRCIRRDRP